jgi:hypothetical protein
VQVQEDTNPILSRTPSSKHGEPDYPVTSSDVNCY